MPRPLAKILPWLALLAALAYGWVHWQGKVWPQSAGARLRGEERAFWDFDCYRGAALNLAEGRSVYAPVTAADPCLPPELPAFVYPPTLPVLLRWLAPRDGCRAEWGWFGLNLALVVGLIPLMMAALGVRRTPGLWAAAVFLVLAPMATLENMTLGQINLLILALLLPVVPLLDRGRVGPAGLLVGVAFALKLTPALLGLAFLRRGRAWVWPAAIGLAICGGAFLLAPADSPLTLLHAVGAKSTTDLGDSNNASLVGWAVRAFAPGPVALRWSIYLNAAIVMAAAWLACLWAGRIPSRQLGPVMLALTAAVSPLYEVHHQVLLYPAFLLLVAEAMEAAAWRPRLGRWAGVAALGILTNSRGLVPLADAHDPVSHLLVKPAGLALAALIGWLLVEIRSEGRVR